LCHRKYFKFTVSEQLIGYLFILPALFFFGLYVVYPVIDTIYLSFFEWNGLSPIKIPVGLRNYIEVLFGDWIFRTALRNNIIWFFFTISIQGILGLFLAILVDGISRGKSIFRVVFFIPVVTSEVILAKVWQHIYNPDYGFLNYTFKSLGLSSLTRYWLGDANLALLCVMIVNIWLWTGFAFVLYLAALQSIPREIEEAAEIDGATKFQKLRYVTIPLLRPTTVTYIALGIIGSFKEFAKPWVVTKGGPNHASDLICTYIYKSAFENSRMGYACALSTILLLIIFGATVVQYRSMYKR